MVDQGTGTGTADIKIREKDVPDTSPTSTAGKTAVLVIAIGGGILSREHADPCLDIGGVMEIVINLHELLKIRIAPVGDLKRRFFTLTVSITIFDMLES